MFLFFVIETGLTTFHVFSVFQLWRLRVLLLVSLCWRSSLLSMNNLASKVFFFWIFLVFNERLHMSSPFNCLKFAHLGPNVALQIDTDADWGFADSKAFESKFAQDLKDLYALVKLLSATTLNATQQCFWLFKWFVIFEKTAHTNLFRLSIVVLLFFYY